MTSKNHTSSSSYLKRVYWVPGLPHVLQPQLNDSYQKLHDGMLAIAADIAAQKIERLLYFSTGWISVLGQSVQLGQELRGRHTDENWHELADLEFDFAVDREFGLGLIGRFQQAGLPAHKIDYVGFPVDTGTLVADRLLNPRRLPVSMVACHVYSDFPATERIAHIVREQIEASQRATAVVCVSGLSGRYFTSDIDPREDRISDAADDRWNHKLLAWLESGDYKTLEAQLPEYAAATKADMGLKAYAFAKGVYGGRWPGHAKCLAYGGLYGTGAAVVQL